MNESLDLFESSVPIPVELYRPKRQEAHITSLVRALLEASESRMNEQQNDFDEEFTIVDNVDLFASILGIAKRRSFGHLRTQDLRQSLMRSPVFAGMTISLEIGDEWI